MVLVGIAHPTELFYLYFADAWFEAGVEKLVL
jgi:hypothetical protein